MRITDPKDQRRNETKGAKFERLIHGMFDGTLEKDAERTKEEEDEEKDGAPC